MENKLLLDNYRKKPNVIPPVVYQTWHTKDMHPIWDEQFKVMKERNKHIKFVLFTDEECRGYIKTNFDSEVLWAYDMLAPTAYKADLWRYCVLYKEGGIYLDIKLICYELDLLRKEEFLRVDDLKSNKVSPGYNIETYSDENYINSHDTVNGLWQAVMASQKGSKILKAAIDNIIKNIVNQYYGYNSLCPTGPQLIYDIAIKFNVEYINMKLEQPYVNNNNNNTILVTFFGFPIIKVIDFYRENLDYNFKKLYNHDSKYYSKLWLEKAIYNTNELNYYYKATAYIFKKYKNIHNVCKIDKYSYLFENNIAFDYSNDNMLYLKNPYAAYFFTLYNKKTSEIKNIKTPFLIKKTVSGLLDAKIGPNNIITFKAINNNQQVTVIINNRSQIANKKLWIPIENNDISFFKNQNKNIYAILSWYPSIEVCLYESNYNKYNFTNKKIICEGNSLIHTTWVSHGISINNEIWFLGRKTLRKRSYTTNLHISYTYQWVVLDEKLKSLIKSETFYIEKKYVNKVSHIAYNKNIDCIVVYSTCAKKGYCEYYYKMEAMDDLMWFE